MKRIYRTLSILLVFFLCLFSNPAKATHFKGGDIYFVCLGNGTYKLVFTCYYSCEVSSALPYPLSSINWSLTSLCGTVPTSLPAISPTTATLGSNLPLYCTGVLTTCDYPYSTGASPPAGTPDGTLYVNYESDTFHIPANCTVTATMDEGSRNNAVTNLTNPGGQDLNIEASITTDPSGDCNNSPQFNNYPVNVFCLNQRATFDHGANNLNGDSLTYTLVNPQTTGGSPIAFNSSCTTCSATLPMGQPGVASSYVSIFNFNNQTGSIDFLPTQVGNYVMAVQVNDYHNGVLVGTTMRDIQILVTSNCTPNNNPAIIKKFSVSNVTGASIIDSTHLSICPGGTMHFDLPAADPDAGNYVVDSTNASLILPGSTVTVTHSTGARDTATLHVSWTPLLSDTGFHYLSITVSDTVCPKAGKQTYSFIISVISSTNAGPDKYLSCRPFASVNMSAVGLGGLWSIPSGNPAPTTIVTPTSPTTTISGFTTTGTYKYVWSAGTCRDTAYVIVTEKPNAGPDVSTCQNVPVNMAGVGVGIWAAMTGNPSATVIANTTSPTTSISGFTTIGTYRFIWTNLTCHDTALVVVTSSASAGSDRAICQYSTTTATGTGAGTWSAVAGNPTTTTIATPNAASTNISGFSSSGTYYFTYGSTSCKDTMVVVVTNKPYAGPDQSICANAPITTSAVGGSGTGVTADQYTFSYSTGGTLQSMTGASTACGANDDSSPNAPTNIGFTFYYEGVPYTQFSASPDGWLRLGGTAATAEWVNSITSAANAPRISPYWDDMATGTTGAVSYLVTGTAPNRILVVQWYVTIPRNTVAPANSTFQLWMYEGTNVIQARYGVMGPGTMSATVGLTGAISTNFNAVTLLTASSSNITTNDFNSIQPPFGTVGTFTPPLPSGTWSALSTNPVATSIASPNSGVTTISGYTTPGTYGYVWSLGGCTDTMDVFYIAAPNAGPDQNICQNASATMAATVSAGSSWLDPGTNPGATVIANLSSPTTTISGFIIPGTYLYYWGASGCYDAVQINVTTSPNAGADQTICTAGTTITTAASGGTSSQTADQYSFTSGSGTSLASMAGASTLCAANDDDNPNLTPVNIGFNFVYEGVTYTQFSASPDGWLRLGSVAAAAEYINAITSATNAPRLSAYWDDLATGTNGAVTYTVTGTAPNRILVVQWFVTIPRNTAGAANSTFQMWLYENGGRIEYRYGTMFSSALMTSTVGLTGAVSTNFNAVTIAGATSSNAVVNDNNTVQPAFGTIYTFLPPTSAHWTALASNPAATTITSTTSPVTTISGFTVQGTYRYTWSSGSCSDTMSIIYRPANAGPDQSICQNNIATMAATGTGTWSALGGNPSVATITSVSSPTTTISGLSTAGVYQFLWSNSGCSDTVALRVTAKPNAGPDQIACPNSTVTQAASGSTSFTAGQYIYSTSTGGTLAGMAGASTLCTANDDDNPNIIPVTIGFNFVFEGITYTQFSASPDGWLSLGSTPASAEYINAINSSLNVPRISAYWDDLATGTTGAVTYTVSGTAPNRILVVNWFVTIPRNTAGAANSSFQIWLYEGSNRIEMHYGTMNSGTMSASTGLTGAISSNFESVTISSNTMSNAVANDINAGQPASGRVYTFDPPASGTWSAMTTNPVSTTITTPASPTTTVTGLSSVGTYGYIWNINGCTDTMLVVVNRPNAGPDKSICQNTTVNMAATGTGTWTASAGNPASVSITGTTSPTTSVSGFTTAGTYVLLWTNGGCSDTALVVVTGKPNAGPDRTVCQNTTATMAGSGTGTWTAMPGNPSTATITTPSSPTTTITALTTAGTYNFIWTNGSCSDTASVIVNTRPNAGADRTVCQNTTATMGGSGTATWSALFGNPATAIITSPGSPTTTITGLTAAGTYNFLWSNGSCADTASVIVTAKPNAGADQTACQFTSATMAGTGTGTWTAQAGNPSVATISTPSSPTTTITGLSVAGIYNFIWTNNGCTDTASVIVTAKPNAGVNQTTCQFTTATMAATGTGSWSAQAGNPATATITTASSPTTTITGLTVAGTYNFIWTNNGCTDTASVIVTAKPNAGSDQTVCQFTAATMSAIGTGTWTAQAGNPSVATIATPSSPTTTITGLSVSGIYNFIWTNNGCTDTAKVTVTAKPNAGADQTICQFTTATMAATGTGTWTALGTNPATTTIATGSSPTTVISGFNVSGTYSYVWSNAGCTDTASVIVTAKPNAGGDQTLCQFSTATMSATGTGTWSAQAGNPATAIITSATSPTTTITGLSVAGTYNFIWTNNGCSDTASVIVTAKPNAGSDQTVCQYTTATMTATGTGTWTAQAGNPVVATITNTTSPVTTITGLSTAGTYKFIWTNNGCTDTASVIVTAKPNAGGDQTLCQFSTATMSATGTGTWSAQAGNPATAIITSATSPTTTITGLSVAGTYNFIWTNNGCSDTASITVTAKPNAGSDQTVCQYTTATMTATGTGTWTAQAGNPVVATITNTTSPVTTITGLSTAGTYTFIWSNNGCTDTASVIVTAKPNAGGDQTLCQFSTATMSATGTGTWSAQAGNPATAIITSATSPTTTITGLSVAGTYNFIWTNNGCTDTASITVTAKPNAGSDQTICQYTTATMTATGTGTWTALAGNPVVATITNASSPTTTITGLTVAGTYNFIWSNNGCTDTASVIVTAKPNAGGDQTLCQFSSATMSATGIGTWSAQAGNPATAIITSATSPTTTITGLSVAGIYNFIWTNNGCSDTATVTVTAKPNAGSDQTICQYTTATMTATGTGTWTALIGNPAVATITNTTLATTTITGLNVAGTYTFIWSNNGCTDTASVIVTAKPNAGADQGICQFNTLTMAATGTGTWSAFGTNPATTTFAVPTSPTTSVSGFSAIGIYGFVWSNNGCTDTMIVTVTLKPNAGPDQSTCQFSSVTMAAVGTGTWTPVASNPGTATITTPTSATTTITGFSAAGTYSFLWSNGGCYDTANVVVTAKPNAGIDQTVCQFNNTAMTATGTGTWSAFAGNPSVAIIANTTSPTTAITGLNTIGTYTFLWSNSGCTDTMTITVTTKPNAGLDQNTCQFSTATMAGTGTGTWLAMAGNPATTTIATPASPTTSISGFTLSGTYNYIWSNGAGCSDTASVTVTAKPNAGNDQTICQYNTTSLAATGTGTWSAPGTNPAATTFTNAGAANTAVSGFSTGGTYSFVWMANGCTDTMNVNVTAKPNAGGDQTICQYTAATMAATGTGTWTAMTGNPSTTSIVAPTSATTTINGFTAAGTYNFIWTNSGCTDTMSVSVTAKPNAGSDQTTCQYSTATMSATGTGIWSALATNPAVATIANTTANNTGISGLTVAGTYGFVWTNNGCTDTANVIVIAKPNAGSDQTICQYTSTTMSATGTGIWTAMTGNPATATIAVATSPATAITGFSAAGTYSFIWTSNGCADTASVTVTAKPNAGADQTICQYTTVTMSATGTGTWTAFGTNPAVTTIANTTLATTSISGFTAPGTYNFVWTNNGCTDTAKVIVTAKPNAGGDQTICQYSPATMSATGTGTWSAMAGNPATATITAATSPATSITGFTVAGAYSFVWTNNGCTDTTIVNVTAKPDAGPDQNLGCFSLGMTATMSASGAGIWSALSTNPSTTTIALPSLAVTTITGFALPGVYSYVWTVNGCTDTMTVSIAVKPNAGADQSTCQYSTATMAGTGTGTWSAMAGNPAVTTIATPASPVTSISGFTVAGTYSFIWSNAGCTDTAMVTVTAKPDAGTDQTICQYTTTNLAATGTGTWSALGSNPAVATIANTSSTTTGLSGFTASGAYSFVWMVNGCTDTTIVNVTAKPNAGADQTICQFNPATMAATGIGTWTAFASNPSVATITNATSPTSSVTGLNTIGTYSFVWSNNGCTDTVSLIVIDKPDAGPDQSTCQFSTATMAATGTGTWSIMTGNPAATVIANTTSATTSISGFTSAGTYYYIWSAGTCTDTAAVIVTAKPNAGTDQTICQYNTATMVATGTGTWSALASNPAVTVFANANSATTAVSGFTAGGTYGFVWTVSGCTDTVTLNVTAKPDAGADQTICEYTTVTMSATGTGSWSALASNPTTTVIANASSATTGISGFTGSGNYGFVWTVNGCTDTMTVNVLASPNAGPDQNIGCLVPGSSVTMAGSGTGTWSELATNPATTNIINPSSPTTTISGFTIAGTYIYTISNGTCSDTAQVVVTTKPDAGIDQTICQYTDATMAAVGTGTWTALASNPATVSFTNANSATTDVNGFSAAGNYNLVWTVSGCTDTVMVSVTAKPNAGADQTICQYSDAGMNATGTGTWAELSTNTVSVTIANTSSPTTLITGFSTAGTYGFVWTVNGCTDTTNIIVTAKPDAGVDQTICQYTDATMNAVGTGTWSASASNPAVVTFANAGSATTTVSGFSAGGNYDLVWTVNGCTDTVTVTVTAKPDAGADQTICQYTDATMNAAGTGTWTTLSTNPAIATIANTSSAATTITGFNTAGTYGFVWTVNGCTDTTNVIVTAKPDAGADQTTCQYSTATMAAAGIGTWSALGSNPAAVIFANANSATTSVSGFAASGNYALVWTVNGCTDTMNVSVTAKPDAGSDQTICQYTDATMSAAGTGTWSALASNPIAVTIANTTSGTTNITGFTTAGTYGFVWTVNGCTDTANVIVTAKPDAGIDQIACQYSTVTMAGAGTGTWTADVSNPALVAFANANSATTTVSGFSASGTYTLIWTVNGCTDTMSISVTAKPDAGIDQNICQYTTTSLAAAGTGTWSALSSNPATATIANTALATSAVSGFTVAGTYSFVWTANGCTDTMSIIVAAKPDAGTDQTVCINAAFSMNATGRGTWTALSTNPAGAVVTLPTAPTSPVTFTTTGSYGFIWTNGSGCSDTVTLTVVAAPAATFAGVNGSCTNAPSVKVNTTGGTSPYTYIWSSGSTVDSVANPTAGSSYTVTVSDANHCSATATGSVSTTAVNVTLHADSSSESCPGRNDGRIVVTAIPANAYTYHWGGASSTTDSITGLAAGIYTVTVTDATGCSATATYTLINPAVATLDILPSDTTIYKGTSAQLNTVFGPYSSGAATYTWLPATGLSCVDCPDPVATPADSFTIYTLTVQYNNGCIVTAFDTIHLIANDTVIIPTAFTPNGDGVNDEFIILGRGVKSLSLSIYNRWGEMVFSTTDVNVGWDGFYKSSPQPGEIYTYFLSADFIGGGHTSKEGTLTLIR